MIPSETAAPETIPEALPEAPPAPPQYGKFSNRMLASAIDICILFMFALPVVDFMMGQLFPPVNQERLMELLNSPDVKNNSAHMWAAIWEASKEQHILQRMIMENLLQIGFIAFYTLTFWFRYSTTPGKMLFRLQIVDEKTGEPMSDKQAVKRFLGYFVSGAILSFGFIWILFNKKQRGFHDIIAGTVVIVKPKRKQPL